MQLTHAWQPIAWPDYAALPLPPGARRDQYPFRQQQALEAAAAAAGPAAGQQQHHHHHHHHHQKQASGDDDDGSPWHLTYHTWLAELQAGSGGSGSGAIQAAHACMAVHLAAQQQAQAQAQQRGRGQSTAASAAADEFDAGLFKEAAGAPPQLLPPLLLLLLVVTAGTIDSTAAHMRAAPCCFSLCVLHPFLRLQGMWGSQRTCSSSSSSLSGAAGVATGCRLASRPRRRCPTSRPPCQVCIASCCSASICVRPRRWWDASAAMPRAATGFALQLV